MHSYFKVVGKLSFLCSVSVDGVIVGLIPGCRCNETKVVKIAAKLKARIHSLGDNVQILHQEDTLQKLGQIDWMLDCTIHQLNILTSGIMTDRSYFLWEIVPWCVANVRISSLVTPCPVYSHSMWMYLAASKITMVIHFDFHSIISKHSLLLFNKWVQIGSLLKF